MSDTLMQLRPLNAFYSSVQADVWHRSDAPGAYEWWYFDALSDDGREALIVTFNDNYVFSPRYAAAAASEDSRRFPAVSFTYSVNGKPIFRSINEYTERQFVADSTYPSCSIGESSFRTDSADYGSGYLVKIDLPVGPGRRLRAELEWLSIESNLLELPPANSDCEFAWNMAAPRSDVTGHIELVGRRGNVKQRYHFRGTGYHDHFSGQRPLHEAILSRSWGRAHYADSTVVFCVQQPIADDEVEGRIAMVINGLCEQNSVKIEKHGYRRDKYGIKYPIRMVLAAENGVRLKIKPLKVLESSFYSIRMLSEMTLICADGKSRKTLGFSEVMAPKNLKYRLFRWFTEFKIGRNGKGAYF